MKKVLLMSAFVLCLCVLAGIPAASAQPPVIVTVPFSFVVAGTELPAGEYQILTRTPHPTTLHIVRVGGDASTFVNVYTTDVRQVAGQASLVFQRLGDTHFLWRVHAPGENIREIMVPRAAAAAEVTKLATAKPRRKG